CPLFCCTLRRLRRPPPFPYTTLFRSTIALAVTAFGIAGCSSGGSKRSSSSTIVPSQPGGPGGPGGGNGPGTNPGDNTPNKGNLETTLENTGGAVDNLADLGLSTELGVLGKQLDTTLDPTVSPLIDLTQNVGQSTGLDQPTTQLTTELGNTVSNLGDSVNGTDLPLNLGTGVGGLLYEVGQGVVSAGGLLNGNNGDATPLRSTLGHTTEGLGKLTDALAQSELGGVLGGTDLRGSVLQPVVNVVHHVLGSDGS